MYASRRRTTRNFKRVREQQRLAAAATAAIQLQPVAPAPSNPSKRHRERLNGELETVAQLLPYEPAVISRLDKLSVLRLAVSFLQAKAHFCACLHHAAYTPSPLADGMLWTHAYVYACSLPSTSSAPPPPPSAPLLMSTVTTVVPSLISPIMTDGGHHHHHHHHQPLVDPAEPDASALAQHALAGFVLVLNHLGEVFYVSENVESFLGFHQSDLLHQPLFDMIHSEDRDDIRLNLGVAPDTAFEQMCHEDRLEALERNVNARFRCLLDNTCGFLRMDIRGRLQTLHGLPGILLRTSCINVTTTSGSSSASMPSSSSSSSTCSASPSLFGQHLGLVAICTPFVPPASMEPAGEDAILKSKHRLDFTLISADARMTIMLELADAANFLPKSFYSLIHPDDAACLAEAHKEVVKNSSSGLLIYRLVSIRSKRIYFVQSSCRMFFKNSKPDSIGLTHRLLNEVEGTMLLEKRSSLKAKLLSFDDSLLQSPRNLQGAAALPTATAAVSVVDQSIVKLSPQPEQAAAAAPTTTTNGKKKSVAATTSSSKKGTATPVSVNNSTAVSNNNNNETWSSNAQIPSAPPLQDLVWIQDSAPLKQQNHDEVLHFIDASQQPHYQHPSLDPMAAAAFLSQQQQQQEQQQQLLLPDVVIAHHHHPHQLFYPPDAALFLDAQPAPPILLDYHPQHHFPVDPSTIYWPPPPLLPPPSQTMTMPTEQQQHLTVPQHHHQQQQQQQQQTHPILHHHHHHPGPSGLGILSEVMNSHQLLLLQPPPS